MIVYLTSGDVGNLQGKEIHQAAQDAALGLPAQAEKNKILARQKRVRDMRKNRVFVAVNPREQIFPALNLLQEVGAQLILDGAWRTSRSVAGKLAQFAERCGFRVHRGPLNRSTHYYKPHGELLQESLRVAS
jgi:hypothetical protein